MRSHSFRLRASSPVSSVQHRGTMAGRASRHSPAIPEVGCITLVIYVGITAADTVEA